ncbi:MAG: hypothetical protein V1909_03230 [Candidatus Micrarchaeota archaeon]
MATQLIDMSTKRTYFAAHVLVKERGLLLAPHRLLDEYMTQGLNERPDKRGWSNKAYSAARELLAMNRPGETFKRTDLVDGKTNLRVPLSYLLAVGNDEIFTTQNTALLIDPQDFTRLAGGREISLFEGPRAFYSSQTPTTIHPASITVITNITPPGTLIFDFGQVDPVTGLPLAVDPKEREKIPEGQRRALHYHGERSSETTVFPGEILYIVRGLKGYTSDKEINITLRDFRHPFDVLAVEQNSSQ